MQIYGISVVLFLLISVKFLEFVKPFCAVLPEIQKPERKVCLLLLLMLSLFKSREKSQLYGTIDKN